MLDESPIKEVNLNDLRNQIGFVPQDPFLFSDSIENNIKFGKQQRSFLNYLLLSIKEDLKK